jgi:hypothetical protein
MDYEDGGGFPEPSNCEACSIKQANLGWTYNLCEELDSDDIQNCDDSPHLKLRRTSKSLRIALEVVDADSKGVRHYFGGILENHKLTRFKRARMDSHAAVQVATG